VGRRDPVLQLPEFDLAPSGLLTDQYELTMAASFMSRGMADRATFSLFARRLPPNRGFLVAAGLEGCLAFLERFHFHEHELQYLRDVQQFDNAAIDAFRNLRFSGDVWAVPEGRIVFPDEPLLEVTAPLPEAQVVETYLLNQVTYQTAIASKAARCRLAARGRGLADFAFRRTHGTEAAMAVGRVSAIVGFGSTSNVEAARRFGLRASGTMAHSYVEAFPTEAEAFRAFAEDNPDRATFLVDTYETLGGVRAAIDVITSMGLSKRSAIRLDSGDLGTLAKKARSMLDAAGLTQVQIVASGSLDEYVIDDLVKAGAPIDGFGVGTKMGVSADAPYVDTAYKLVQYGDRPVLKLSPHKATLPGPKQVFRRLDTMSDLICARDETQPNGYQPLLEPVMVGGQRIQPPHGVADASKRFEADLSALPDPARALRDPSPPTAAFSDHLTSLAARVRQEALKTRL
jgi:nicotinate phosphoribosyltransferase